MDVFDYYNNLFEKNKSIYILRDTNHYLIYISFSFNINFTFYIFKPLTNRKKC